MSNVHNIFWNMPLFSVLFKNINTWILIEKMTNLLPLNSKPRFTSYCNQSHRQGNSYGSNSVSFL